MKAINTILSVICFSITYSQNVGIGTTTPGFPLNFSNGLGDKISLWGNSGNHYGLGVQSGLLQVHSDASIAHIAFGYGSSSSFNERMRIINNGEYGLSLNGRISLKNGTVPVDPAFSPGIWMYKADNSALLGFMGVHNNQNLGFFGGPAGWGFTYDAINSRVGIGNINPNAPLAFAASLGKKITLYPGATGDVGFGVAGNRLQIYSDNVNADVAIGYDVFGSFVERFAFKPNGALAIDGNIGSYGKALSVSNTGVTNWGNSVNYLYNNIFEFSQTASSGTLSYEAIPGLTQTITLVKRSKVIVNLTGQLGSTSCFGCGSQQGELGISINTLLPITTLVASKIPNGEFISISTGNKVFSLEAGTYNVIGVYLRSSDLSIRNVTASGFRMTVQIIPEE